MRTRKLSAFSLTAVFSFTVALSLLPIFLQPSAYAQDAAVTDAPAQITQAIDPNQLVVLRGNVHPLARPQYDQGAVPDAQPLRRMLLLLQRSTAQETALQQLLDAQQSKSSPSFHAWLTPEQFGAQFGPAASDVQTITSWLAAQGFRVNRVSAGRTIIEFDGTAVQVRNAFHTEIHRYVIDGQEHTANSSDPEIPAALAPVVAGIVSLHNFPAVSHLLAVGNFERTRKSGAIRPLVTPLTNPSAAHPLFTPPNGDGQTFPLVPADFATIYNVTPLWKSGIDGTGQTIAVIGDSNIDVTDIQNFRTLFGLSNNFTSANVLLDGTDPGIVSGSETEADLDLEWSGAVARNATIQLVAAADTETTAGQHLAALYAVDHNLAGVLSESFGECEQGLGSANNQYYNTLWEQAAAQGITVILSAGDGGSAGCDNFDTQSTATFGLAVSGYASTPNDIAVGGTDFDQISKWSQYWSSTNDPVTFASALGYIPEIPWNDSCAQLGLVGCGTSQPGGNLLNIVAGSGGSSTIYSKPSWQSGPGVPADNKRDLPDVSLFASPGFTGSGYLICAADQGGSCQSGSQSFFFTLVGGTSASAPSFAGIMALINHSQQSQNLGNRQGNANNVLYALAKKQSNTTPALNCNASATPASPCTFNDVTSGNSHFINSGAGNNSVPCNGGTPNCSSLSAAGPVGILVNPASTNPKTPAWTTSTGYDLATGLGSVNASNLATNWKSANSTATSTTLSLNSGSAASITHGSPVSVNIAVSPTAAVGQAALIAAMPTGGTLGVAQFTLANGVAAGSTSSLPGGASYNVTAHYEGDGTNAPSDSSSVTVTVAPESSKTFLTVPTFDPKTGNETTNTPTSVAYASPYIVRADVTNSAGSLTQLCANVSMLTCPTGAVAITDSFNGGPAKPLDAGSFALNSAGYTEDQTVQLSGGTHMLSAQYSGDNSYTKSSATTYALTVTPAATAAQINLPVGNPVVGQPFNIAAMVAASGLFNGAAPTGTVTFYDGTTPLSGTINSSGIPGNVPMLYVYLTNSTVSTAGTSSLTAKYSGDANYAPSTTAPVIVTALYPTSTSLTISPQSILYGASVKLTATVTTTNKSPLLTGNIAFSSAATGQITNPITQTATTDASGNTELIATTSFMPQNFDNISAIYPGDANYANSAQVADVQVTSPDFTIAGPQTIVITPGQTATVMLTITPLSNLSSTVMLTCTGGLPVGSACSFAPASVSLANGSAATDTLSITSVGPSPAPAIVLPAQRKSVVGVWKDGPANPWLPLGTVAALVALVLLLSPIHRVQRRATLATALLAGSLCVLSFALGCGGGGGGTTGPPGPHLATTTTTISSSTPKAPYGTPATFTATVTSPDALTGTLTFFVGTSPVSSPNTLVNNSAQVQLSFPVGTTAITAQYSGDVNNLPSTSAAFNQIVTGTTSFTVNAQSGINSHQIYVTATIQ